MSEMNMRLEIASRLMAAWVSRGVLDDLSDVNTDPVLALADDLIDEEARTRQPAGDAPSPDDLRAVAEELAAAVEFLDDQSRNTDGVVDVTRDSLHLALFRCRRAAEKARAMGLGETGGGR